MLVRFSNAMLGVWLFISAFLWPHTVAQFHNAWMTGIIVTSFALAGIAGIRWARFANYGVALWLFLSTLFLPRASSLTGLNHVLVAVLLVITSLFPAHVRPNRPAEI